MTLSYHKKIIFTNRKIFIFCHLQIEKYLIYYKKIENYFRKENKMKINKKKIQIAMARNCMNTVDLQKTTGMPRPTVDNVVSGKNVRPGTVGRIAKALGVDVTEIIEQ